MLSDIKKIISFFVIISCCNANPYPRASDVIINFYGNSASIWNLPLSPPPGYISFENSYYKFHRDPKTFSQARNICEAEGGHLAIVNSVAEADFLVSLMNKYPANTLPDVAHKDFSLIGFHDCFEEGVYVAINGKSLESTGYTTWAGGQPDNAGGNENCGSLHRSGGLNDFPCTIKSTYICEISSPCRNIIYRNQLNIGEKIEDIDVRMGKITDS